MTEGPLYREITAQQFLQERTMRFAPDSPEVTGIRFGIPISHEGTEPLVLPSPWPDPDWQSKLGPISQVMPLDFEAYAGIVLPWIAYRGRERYEVDGTADAYRFFGLTAPEPLTLDSLYADFGILELQSHLPALARTVFDRFAGTAKTIFVKWASYVANEATYWAIERELFLVLENPFAEIPQIGPLQAGGLYAIFPRGCGWYIHHSSDTPILYVAGSADLVAALLQVLKDRVVRLALTDKYYS